MFTFGQRLRCRPVRTWGRFNRGADISGFGGELGVSSGGSHFEGGFGCRACRACRRRRRRRRRSIGGRQRGGVARVRICKTSRACKASARGWCLAHLTVEHVLQGAHGFTDGLSILGLAGRFQGFGGLDHRRVKDTHGRMGLLALLGFFGKGLVDGLPECVPEFLLLFAIEHHAL